MWVLCMQTQRATATNAPAAPRTRTRLPLCSLLHPDPPGNVQTLLKEHPQVLKLPACIAGYLSLELGQAVSEEYLHLLVWEDQVRNCTVNMHMQATGQACTKGLDVCIMQPHGHAETASMCVMRPDSCSCCGFDDWTNAFA